MSDRTKDSRELLRELIALLDEFEMQAEQEQRGRQASQFCEVREKAYAVYGMLHIEAMP